MHRIPSILRYTLVLSLTVSLTVALSACGGEASSSETAPADSAATESTAQTPADEQAPAAPASDTMAAADSAATEQPRADVRDFRVVQLPDGERQFTGDLINNTEKMITVAQVRVTLFDESGSRVGEESIEVDEIPAGGSKAFKKSATTETEFASARVRSVLLPSS